MSQHAARRPKKHPLLRLFALLVLLGALAAGALALLFWREITGRDAAGQTAAVTVEQGSGVGAIAAELKEAGVIRFPRLFRWYVGRQGAFDTMVRAVLRITVPGLRLSPKGLTYNGIPLFCNGLMVLGWMIEAPLYDSSMASR